VADVPTLSAPVGPNQTNAANDMRLVRRYLNAYIRAGHLGPLVEIAAEGGWDSSVASALQNVENFYFFGEADPNNKLESNDTLFQFLVQSELTRSSIAASLSSETYSLAALMVPGGADHIKRTTVKTTEIVNGKSVVKKTVTEAKVSGTIQMYLPDILKALTARSLNDTDMLMMALGTIRAETAGFRPIDEGVSKYNTTPVGTKGRHLFDKYDFKSDLGNSHVGDGALYKGRGFVQLTGHDNYRRIGPQIGIDLIADPDRANEAAVAAAVLAQYLKNKESSVRRALEKNDLAHARRLVNGGSHGLPEFKQAFAAGRKYLGTVVPPQAKLATKKRAVKKKAAK
jgi:hypothetical protein